MNDLDMSGGMPSRSASGSDVRLEERFAPDTKATGLEHGHCHLRSWSRREVRHVQVHCKRGFSVESPNLSRLRVTFLLENGQAGAEFRDREDQRAAFVQPARTVSIIPAGLTVWACSERSGTLRFASLAIEPEDVCTQLGEYADREALSRPHLNFVNESVWQLGAMLARESVQPDALSTLAFDSLVQLLLVQLFRAEKHRREPAPGARLSPAQWRRVSEYIQDNLAQRVSLADLASLAGTSQSHFCHAFKATTGLPPHRWQLEARVRQAQAMLSGNACSLTQIALATGFADQSHFTRVFRRIVGETPGHWRSQKLAS
jgi:AraC-like DNA-binding protein